MLELANQLLPHLRAGHAIVAATAIGITGSGPHPIGTSLALTDDGTVLGNLSGGCVDGAALEACEAVLGGAPARVERFGFGNDNAALVGLACGGAVDVVVARVEESATASLAAAAAGWSAAFAVVVGGEPKFLGHSVDTRQGFELNANAVQQLPTVPRALLREAVDARQATGSSGHVEVAAGDLRLELFVQVVAGAPDMVLVGANEITRALRPMAIALGYRVTITDHRPVASHRIDGTAVTHAHRLLSRMHLDDRSVVCVLDHDEDLDPLTIAVALQRGAGYVGALGSRATNARRLDRLRAFAVSKTDLRRLRAPIGLDIGATTPAQIAVSILAEVVAERTAASGTRLSQLSGPIHPTKQDRRQEAPDRPDRHLSTPTVIEEIP